MLFRSGSDPTVFDPRNARCLPFGALTAHNSGQAGHIVYASMRQANGQAGAREAAIVDPLYGQLTTVSVNSGMTSNQEVRAGAR